MDKEVVVIKASGKEEDFSEEKLTTSIKRAGAEEKLATETVKGIEEKIKDRVDTDELYRSAFSQLRKTKPAIAAKYSLKRAIMELGPAGYVFERYFARVLEEHGYSTEVGQIVNGRCVRHEVDVIAKKDGQKSMIECKYHNRRGIRSDTKVALYTNSRFLDIKDRDSSFTKAWLVTNTRCTRRATRYAECVGVRVVAWRYPRGEGLEYFIESKGLYPITIIPSLPKKALPFLIQAGVALAGDVLKFKPGDLEKRFGFSKQISQAVIREARELDGK